MEDIARTIVQIAILGAIIGPVSFLCGRELYRDIRCRLGHHSGKGWCCPQCADVVSAKMVSE